MFQQQTAALQAMVGALQSLSATIKRTSHINSRVNACTMKRQQEDMQIPHSESELHGLCAIAESALKQILKARKAAPVSVQQAVEKSIRNYRGSRDVYFQSRTAALTEKNITALVDGAMEQVKQYSRCANPRCPCSAFNDLIKTYNVPEIDLSDKWTEHECHKQYTYHQDGSVASTHKCIVDPGIFWTTELKRKVVDDPEAAYWRS